METNLMGRPVRAEVEARKGEHAERLIRRFIKKVKKERIIEQIRDLQFFEKPSVKRNRDKQRIKRLKRLERNEKK
jgi:small subunit ribosomal protein S21